MYPGQGLKGVVKLYASQECLEMSRNVYNVKKRFLVERVGTKILDKNYKNASEILGIPTKLVKCEKM